ncbi:MAG: hypothetical protein GX111_08895, partial [Clostridiales bacterium]|nr:hypothetical protein [Clostridiales bacterium]
AGRETKEKIADELRDHLALVIEEEFLQRDPALAAVKRMGSPRLTGKRYNKCYIVFMTPWDWFLKIAFYLAPIIPGTFIQYQIDALPLWVSTMAVGLFALFFGRLYGKKLIRWQACVWTAAFPLFLSFMDLFVAKPNSVFIFFPTADFHDALICSFVWILVFSAACLLFYGKQAFPDRLFIRIRAAMLLFSVISLCFSVGYTVFGLRQHANLQTNAVGLLRSSLDYLSEESPEYFGPVMPNNLAYAVDIQISYVVNNGYSYDKQPFSFLRFLTVLAEFGDDFDTFRQSSYGDDPMLPFESFDVRLIPYFSFDERAGLIKDTLRRLSDCCALLQNKGSGILDKYHSPGQLKAFSDSLYQVEAGFRDALRSLPVNTQNKSIAG